VTGTRRLATFHSWLPITEAPSASRALQVQNSCQSRAGVAGTGSENSQLAAPMRRAITPVDSPYSADHWALENCGLRFR